VESPIAPLEEAKNELIKNLATEVMSILPPRVEKAKPLEKIRVLKKIIAQLDIDIQTDPANWNRCNIVSTAPREYFIHLDTEIKPTVFKFPAFSYQTDAKWWDELAGMEQEGGIDPNEPEPELKDATAPTGSRIGRGVGRLSGRRLTRDAQLEEQNLMDTDLDAQTRRQLLEQKQKITGNHYKGIYLLVAYMRGTAWCFEKTGDTEYLIFHNSLEAVLKQYNQVHPFYSLKGEENVLRIYRGAEVIMRQFCAKLLKDPRISAERFLRTWFNEQKTHLQAINTMFQFNWQFMEIPPLEPAPEEASPAPPAPTPTPTPIPVTSGTPKGGLRPGAVVQPPPGGIPQATTNPGETVTQQSRQAEKTYEYFITTLPAAILRFIIAAVKDITEYIQQCRNLGYNPYTEKKAPEFFGLANSTQIEQIRDCFEGAASEWDQTRKWDLVKKEPHLLIRLKLATVTRNGQMVPGPMIDEIFIPAGGRYETSSILKKRTTATDTVTESYTESNSEEATQEVEKNLTDETTRKKNEEYGADANAGGSIKGIGFNIAGYSDNAIEDTKKNLSTNIQKNCNKVSKSRQLTSGSVKTNTNEESSDKSRKIEAKCENNLMGWKLHLHQHIQHQIVDMYISGMELVIVDKVHPPQVLSLSEFCGRFEEFFPAESRQSIYEKICKTGEILDYRHRRLPLIRIEGEFKAESTPADALFAECAPYLTYTAPTYQELLERTCQTEELDDVLFDNIGEGMPGILVGQVFVQMLKESVTTVEQMTDNMADWAREREVKAHAKLVELQNQTLRIENRLALAQEKRRLLSLDVVQKIPDPEARPHAMFLMTESTNEMLSKMMVKQQIGVDPTVDQARIPVLVPSPPSKRKNEER
jgi:hypothetical protein